VLIFFLVEKGRRIVRRVVEMFWPILQKDK
jgi:hypothetical protein